jgi:hypothetical protein
MADGRDYPRYPDSTHTYSLQHPCKNNIYVEVYALFPSHSVIANIAPIGMTEGDKTNERGKGTELDHLKSREGLMATVTEGVDMEEVQPS